MARREIRFYKNYFKEFFIEQEEKGIRRDNVFIQISESQVGRAIRTEKFKYSVRALKSGFLGKDSKVLRGLCC